MTTPAACDIPGSPFDLWIEQARQGNRFDLFNALGDGPSRQLTRARFDGKSLWLGHWVGRARVVLLELRPDPEGRWFLRPCPRRGGPQCAAWAALALMDALRLAPPTQPCRGARRFFWPA